MGANMRCETHGNVSYVHRCDRCGTVAMGMQFAVIEIVALINPFQSQFIVGQRMLHVAWIFFLIHAACDDTKPGLSD